MKRLGSIIALAASALAACQEPDPSFGDPNGIWGKKLPGEKPTTAPTGSTAEVPAPTTSLAAAHGSDKGKAGSAPLTDVPDCLGCHSGTAAPKFSFGGRVESGTAGVANVVVTVDDIAPVKSDGDGYFWSTTGEVAKGATVKVQKGSDPATVMGPLLAAGAAGGGCMAAGSCHKGSAGPIQP